MNAQRWTARIIQGIMVLFLVFDFGSKYFMTPPVAKAFTSQGMPLSAAPVIATILLVITVFYVIPRTWILGAVLLTGYLGGACACNLRAGLPVFMVVFPLIFGVIAWIPVYMLEPQVRAVLPVRKEVVR